MKKEEYNELVKKYTPKYNRLRSALLAFIVGGMIGLLGQGLIDFYSKVCGSTIKDAGSYMIVTLIFLSSLFTAMGFFDDIVSKVKCGIIVPITLNPTIDSISVNTIILGIVRSGIGKINAKINIMYQKLRPLNEYLDNAKPVVSDTAV